MVETKGGATNLKVGGVNVLEEGRQYSENTTIWKRWGFSPPPSPSSHGGDAPGLNYTV